MHERRAARRRRGGLPTRTLLCLLPCLWPAGLAGAAERPNVLFITLGSAATCSGPARRQARVHRPAR